MEICNYSKRDRVPDKFDGEILVPFAIESSLSGVCRRIDEKQELVYLREFDIPSAWKDKKILLHFGAVDWENKCLDK